jgi:hypothetical protein
MVALPEIEAALALLERLRGAVGDRLASLEIMSRGQIEVIAEHVPDVAIPFALDSPWYMLIELTDTRAGTGRRAPRGRARRGLRGGAGGRRRPGRERGAGRRPLAHPPQRLGGQQAGGLRRLARQRRAARAAGRLPATSAAIPGLMHGRVRVRSFVVATPVAASANPPLILAVC